MSAPMDAMKNAPSQQQDEKSRILVAASDDDLALFLHAMLENAGYEVLVARSGADALEIAHRAFPHLVLLDAGLSDGLSGYEVCRALKSKESFRTRPIVFVTHSADEEEYLAGLRVGALDFITQPINFKILLTKVRTLTQLSRDDCELQRVHAELQGSCDMLKRFSLALDSATDGVVISDKEGMIGYANVSFERLVGVSSDELEGKNLMEYVANAPLLKKSFYGALEGMSSKVRLRLEGEAGATPVLVKCSPILDGEGRPSGLLFMVVDESEREIARKMQARLEADLLHAQKLESVGQLAAGIAHEINTPTQFVGDNIQFVKDALREVFDLQDAQDALLRAARQGPVSPELLARVEGQLEQADIEYLREELPVAIEQSLEGINRVATIVRAMKDFAHPGKTEKTPSDLNEAIRTTATVARNRWKYVAELHLHLDEQLPLVPCLVSEFNQVVLNLIVNASDAIAERFKGMDQLGEITISTHHDGGFALVEVRDTGGGIPERIQARVFDPFFTTKEVGKGSGQGLAIAHNVVVVKHQGKLDFKTVPGEGTTFTIKLPMN